MTAVVRVGEFAPPARAEELHAAVDGQLERLRCVWPDLAVERHRYRAPPQLLDHQLVIAEVRSEYRRHLEAAGCALTCEQAAGAAGGELLERLAQIRIADRDMRVDSERQLHAAGHRVFDVAAYLGEPLFPDRWPFARYTADLSLPWVSGRDAQTGEPVLLPTSLIVNRWEAETVICEITSNGTAAAASQRQATDHAMRELAERDALRVAWLREQPLTEVAPPVSWTRLREHDQRLDWNTRFFTLPTVVGPPAWAVVTRHVTEAVFAIGTACTEDRDRGLEHAVAEAVQGRLLGWLSRDRPRPDRVEDFNDHLAYYSTPERLPAIDTLFSPNGQRSADTVPTTTTSPLSGAVVLTLLEHDAAHAVKVLAPGLQPVEGNHDAARLVGHARAIRRSVLNTRPHPFG